MSLEVRAVCGVAVFWLLDRRLLDFTLLAGGDVLLGVGGKE